MLFIAICIIYSHKKNCKSINKQRQLVDARITQIDGMPWSVHEAMVAIIEYGGMLVTIGYQESDTIVHGNMYYREALKYFVLPIKFLRDGLHHTYSFMEDNILLMLVALGGDNETIKSWCTEMKCSETKSLRSEWYTTVSDEEDACGLSIRGLVEEDMFFHFLYLFNSFKSLAVHRQNLERIESHKEVSRKLDPNSPMDDISKNICPYLGCTPGGEVALSDNIRQAISAFRRHGNESYLIHLRDSIPFSKEHAPDLFRESKKSSTPGPEMWMILQDCFFETPGVRVILDEFFEDE